MTLQSIIPRGPRSGQPGNRHTTSHPLIVMIGQADGERTNRSVLRSPTMRLPQTGSAHIGAYCALPWRRRPDDTGRRRKRPPKPHKTTRPAPASGRKPRRCWPSSASSRAAVPASRATVFLGACGPHNKTPGTPAASGRGVRVRLCFGDPAAEAVETRGSEEGIGATLAAKIRSSLTYYRETAASLFRNDDQIMVNPHAFGEPASANPTLHLRRLDGGQVAAHYMSSFERVWDTAKPWTGEDV
jgi:hypothetical protein